MSACRIFGVLGMIAVLASLVGCTSQLPPWETVTSEADAAMQLVVDVLPASSEVEDLSTGTPFECPNGGAVYTGHLAVYPTGDFDGEAFIATLPEALGSEWTVDDDALPLSRPNVVLRSNGINLQAVVVDVDGRVGVDIQAISRCGQMPTPDAP